jgi:hypothetical protein
MTLPWARSLVLAFVALACVDLRPPGPGAQPVSGGVVDPAPTIEGDEFGVGWVRRDGVLESYADRVRIQLGPGWEPMTDDRIAQELPLAGVGLEHVEDGVGIAVTFVAHIHGMTERDYHAHRFGELWSAQQLTDRHPAMTASFADGHSLTLDSGSGERANEFVDGVRLAGEGGLELVAWYPRDGDRERLRERVREGIAAIELLSPAEVDSLRSALRDRPDRQSAVGVEWSLRRGLYRDFVRDFTWAVPAGWNVYTGSIASKIGPWAIVAQNRDAGLIAYLNINEDPRVPGLDEEQWHSGLAELAQIDQLELVGERRRIAVGPVDALVQRVVRINDGKRFLFDHASIKHGSLAMWWIVGGAEELVARDDTLLETVVANTRVDAGLVEIRTEGDRLIDERWGYALQVPADAIRRESTMLEYLEASSWSSEQGSIVLYVYDWSGSRRDAIPVELFARVVQESFPAFEFGEPRVSTIELAGEQARHSSWVMGDYQCDVVSLTRDRNFYQFAVVGQGSQPFERVRDSFALLD